MTQFKKIIQRIVLFFTSNENQRLRAKELQAWTELQIASQMIEENFSKEQNKISELVIHHTRQINHIIFSIEDLIENNDNIENVPEKKSVEMISKESLPEEPVKQYQELKLVLREIKTSTQFLKELFVEYSPGSRKRTIPSKIKDIEMSLHSLAKNSHLLKKIHKVSLQQYQEKSPWQDHSISLLEELYRIETTLNSMKNILLQSRQGRYGPLLDTAQILYDMTTQREEVQLEMNKSTSRTNATINQRKDIESELQTIELSPKFKEVGDLQSQEQELNDQLEKIEDTLYILFARLKDSLSDLADLNSDYELLEIIKEIESLQEDPLQYFNPELQDRLLPLLNWVLAKIASEELEIPIDDENPFNQLHHEIISSKMKILEEKYMLIQEQKKTLPRRKMMHPMYANTQNLRYKRDHYLSQETKLASEQQILKEKLGMVTSKAMQYKNHFEELAKEHFGKDVEVELR